MCVKIRREYASVLLVLICHGLVVAGAVYGAGVAAAAATILLGIFSLLSVFQIAMVVSKDQVVMRYSKVVVSKLVLAVLAGLFKFIYKEHAALGRKSLRIKSLHTPDGRENLIKSWRLSIGVSWRVGGR